MIVDSVEPLPGERVEYTVKGARETGKPRKCRQRGKKTGLNGSYYRRFCRDVEVPDRALLKEVKLTARKGLNHWALDSSVYELGKQEQSDRAELERKN